MSNSLLNSSVIAKESLMQFKNALGFTRGVNRQYDKQFARSGAKIGNTINIRKPQRYTVSDGAVVDLQNVSDETIALTLDQRKHVAFQFSTEELTLNIEEFSPRYLAPAALALANKVDFTGLAKAETDVYNAVGAPGTTPTDVDVALDAGQKLNEFSCPQGDRSIILNPKAQNKIVFGGKALFNPTAEIAKQYKSGVISQASGFDWRMAQNVKLHTVGPLGGTPAVKTDVSTEGATSVVTKTWTSAAASRLKKGDVITFADVYAVNPLSFESTGELQQFVVTADMSSNSSGEGTVSFLPAIYTADSGAKQNVTKFPEADDAILIFGAASTYANKVSPCNIAYHKDAFILGTADLEIPNNVEMGSVARDPESGLSIRFIRFYDGVNDRLISRLDILFGWLTARPEWACRIQG